MRIGGIRPRGFESGPPIRYSSSFPLFVLFSSTARHAEFGRQPSLFNSTAHSFTELIILAPSNSTTNMTVSTLCVVPQFRPFAKVFCPNYSFWSSTSSLCIRLGAFFGQSLYSLLTAHHSSICCAVLTGITSNSHHVSPHVFAFIGYQWLA
jgi:hypothetical protein